MSLQVRCVHFLLQVVLNVVVVVDLALISAAAVGVIVQTLQPWMVLSQRVETLCLNSQLAFSFQVYTIKRSME